MSPPGTGTAGHAGAIGIGVVGVGGVGRVHAERLAGSLPMTRLVAVADRDAGRAEQVAARLGARVEPDAMSLIHAPDIDAVLLATPAADHERDLLACLAAGKPVFCEKPLAPTPAACERVIDAERRALRAGRLAAGAAVLPGARLVTVGFMRRFDPAYQRMRATLSHGRLGAPLLLHAVHRNATVPAGYTPEMLILDTAVHEFDVIRWLLDDEVATVRVDRSRPSSMGPPGLIDPLVVVATTRAGVRADVEVFVRCQYGYEIRCEVVAERGVVDLVGSGGPSRPGADYHERFADAFAAELRAWVAGLAGGPPLGATAADGDAAARITAAAASSLASGSAVVVD
ncbi:MAG TPA: Gfo/Idh/MocA family oxidoreductase [Dermatophilaceae bacterium]|nr:Gfo/Idh/MocA family oxidoreductase [Dermatophilaceae bacterium]